MLFDPKWQKQEAHLDAFSLASLVAWLETQRPEKTYCYMNRGGCLLHTYFTAKGFEKLTVGGREIWVGENRERIEFGGDFENIAVITPHTFGAALERARGYAAARTLG